MAKLETVEVDRNGTKVIVNKSDFDSGKDKLWGQKASPKADAPMSEDDYLAKEYESLYGKKPHHKMKKESIREAINAKSEDE